MQCYNPGLWNTIRIILSVSSIGSYIYEFIITTLLIITEIIMFLTLII